MQKDKQEAAIGLDCADAGAAAARWQCQIGVDCHPQARQIRRRHAAVPDGAGVRARQHYGRAWHPGALGHCAGRKSPEPAGGRPARDIAVTVPIHGDETTLQVLKEDGKSAQCQSYALVYRSAADSACPVVLFDYQPRRGQQHPQTPCRVGTVRL